MATNRTASESGRPPLGEPRVAIFWVVPFDGSIILDSTELSAADSYGQCLTHPHGHIDHWDKLRAQGRVQHLEQQAVLLPEFCDFLAIEVDRFPPRQGVRVHCCDRVVLS
jgi:hypothetical protein